jgi:Ni,Fe-hydrogenase I small subunit
MHLPYQPPGSKSENSHGLDRRDFVKTCMMAAASVGLEADQGHEANLLMAHGFLRN